MSFNNGPTIVTNGLVLALDAGDRNSYVSGSTTWFDLTGVNNGTLTNGPTFNTGSGGSIVFDGVDDYTLLNKTFMANASSGTFDIWFNLTTTVGSAYSTVSNILIGKPSGPDNSFGFEPNTNILKLRLGNVTNLTSSIAINTGSWQSAHAVWDSTGMSIYQNGILTSNIIVSGSSWFGGTQYDTVLGRNWIGLAGGSLTGKIASVKVYNRALSAQEILQNYNATKGRFGLT
jgi:hypothetical protein